MGIMDNEGHDPQGFGNVRPARDLYHENRRLRAALADIRDAKEPKDDRADDDADWRFCALEMKRVAGVVLRSMHEQK